MEAVWRDIRYALRSLHRSRGFAVVAIACLALGIGATTTIFSLVNAYYLKPMPVAQPDRLAKVREYWKQYGGEQDYLAPLNVLDWTADSSIFQGTVLYKGAAWSMGGTDSPEFVSGAWVTSNLFTVLGVQPVLGRSFLADEGAAGRNHVVVLSDGLWRRRFATDPGVLGTTVLLNNAPYTVVGVMPPMITFPGDAQLWAPFTPDRSTETRDNTSVRAITRLRPGVTIARADAHVRAVSQQLAVEFPKANTGLVAHVRPFRDQITEASQIRTIFLIMLGSVGFVLLIACANLANLLLARATTRQREIAIRTALGAGRGRLVRQLLTESVLVALAGGALGILVAMWGLDLISSAPAASGVPPWQAFDIDGRVLLFTTLVSLATGLLFGTLPALRATRPDLTESLKAGGHGSIVGVRNNRLRSGLVVAEVALSMVLLVGAGLMIHSVLRLERVDPGFDAAHMLMVHVALGGTRYDSARARPAFFGELTRRIEALPGIDAAAASAGVPIRGMVRRTISIEGRTPPPGGERVDYYNVINGHYFRALGVPVLTGRLFTEHESEVGGNVAIINQGMARHYWEGTSAVGQRIRVGTDSAARWVTIVGVVADFRPSGLAAPVGDQLYVPQAMDTGWGMTLLVHTAGDPAAVTSMIRREVARMAPAAALYGIATMDAVVRDTFSESRLMTSMFGAFAAVALLLATLGIYGVMAYAVAQRTHEIGVRMALGAQHGDVLSLVIRHGVGLTLVGVIVGLLGAFAVTRALTSLLYGVSPLDPVSFAVTAALLGGVALLASYLPARRAARVDPMVALRSE